MKGEMHPAKNRLWGGLAIDDSFELIELFSGVAKSKGDGGG